MIFNLNYGVILPTEAVSTASDRCLMMDGRKWASFCFCYAQFVQRSFCCTHYVKHKVYTSQHSLCSTHYVKHNL